VTTWRRAIASPLYVLALLAAARPASAQFLTGSVFQVNTSTAAAADLDVAMDASGNFVVVWPDAAGGISGRRYDPVGTPLGTEFGIGTGSSPAVAMGDGGDFLVVWNGATDVQGRLFDPIGTPAGPPFQVAAAAGGADVAADPRGGFVASWSAGAIRARRYDAAGTPGPEFQVSQDTPRSGSSVGVDGEGNVVVGWQSAGGPVFRRFDSSNLPRGGEQGLDYRRARGVVAVSRGGSFEVAWAQDYDVFGRGFDAAGAPLGPPFVIAGNREFYSGRAPSVAPNPARDGEFVVAWDAQTYNDARESETNFRIEADVRNGAGRRVAQSFVPTGLPLDKPLFRGSSQALSASGRGVLVWNKATSYSGSTGNVFGVRLATAYLDGRITRADTGEPIAGAAVTVTSGSVFTDADGHYSASVFVGTSTVTIERTGFTKLTASIPPAALGEISDGDFALSPTVAIEIGLPAVDDVGMGGNGNGVVDPNERFRLRLPIRNVGFVAATGVTVTVSNPFPSTVTLLQATAAYPDLPPGAEGVASVPFELVTSPSFPRRAFISLGVQATIASPALRLSATKTFQSGKTARAAFSAMGPVDIPQSYPAAILGIPVSGVADTISNAVVKLHITHPRVGDLDLYLRGPDGTGTFLTGRSGQSGANFGTDCPADDNDTRFSDGAPRAIGEGIAPFAAAFRPATPLAAFDGLSGARVNGIWQLRVLNNWPYELTGRIECAKLVFDTIVQGTGAYQEVAVAGRVTDASTGTPLAGAKVVTSTGFSTLTGADGRYRMDVLPATMTVTASSPGALAGSASGVVASVGSTRTVDLALRPDLISADGFESGDLSGWDGGNTGGGDLHASPAAARTGGFGLEAVVNDTQAMYVRDLAPADEGHYRARFSIDPTGFDPGEATGSSRAVVFIGLEDAPARRLLQVTLKRSAGSYSLAGRVTRDDGTEMETPFVGIVPGWHDVELEWRKASAPGANDGTFQMWVDHLAGVPLTGIDNDQHSVDFVRLGAMAIKPGASGTIRLDRFESRRESYIGP
jgi:hypothetical protein